MSGAAGTPADAARAIECERCKGTGKVGEWVDIDADEDYRATFLCACPAGRALLVAGDSPAARAEAASIMRQRTKAEERAAARSGIPGTTPADAQQWFHDDEFDAPLPEALSAECARFYGTGPVGVGFAQGLAAFLQIPGIGGAFVAWLVDAGIACSTCGSTRPESPMTCSNGFHAPGRVVAAAPEPPPGRFPEHLDVEFPGAPIGGGGAAPEPQPILPMSGAAGTPAATDAAERLDMTAVFLREHRFGIDAEGLVEAAALLRAQAEALTAATERLELCRQLLTDSRNLGGELSDEVERLREALTACVESLNVCMVAGPRPDIGRLTDAMDEAIRGARAVLGERTSAAGVAAAAPTTEPGWGDRCGWLTEDASDHLEDGWCVHDCGRDGTDFRECPKWIAERVAAAPTEPEAPREGV